ncbi:glucosaminidase domain-containing protein [Mucilaginibacter arboris]|uniref:Peptidoglycan hydrolase n=1 Tax=Mucilaginibacter arboris TaxID=2682090 RepID=A0A7K1SSI6_9SPHI|nr:glucosaminidase domain-containing protein [Mucilaginibacter arboris]MVN20278.1 LysM peptidoglycan-binding domain-containing protein [Mucilaginibacter arboris]
MYKKWAFFLAIIVLASCSTKKTGITAHQASRNNKEVQKLNKDAISHYTTFGDVNQYIDRFRGIAIQEMNTYGIPASITLAQGLIESGNGNGELAVVANNHFGIKCTSDWKGKSYYKNDDKINDCFRVYDNPESSFRDHSEFLKRKRYAPLFELDKNDYEGWAYGLKAAGYATNPAYPQMIINLIKKYNLDQYDMSETDYQKIKREDRVLSQINKNIGKQTRDSLRYTAPAKLPVVPVGGKMYQVKQGDTLFNVSKRFGLSVDELKAMNTMGDDNIKIGQQLIIAH